MKEPDWLVRKVECYLKETDELIGEYTLKPLDLYLLQKYWGQPKHEPMITVFNVSKKQTEFLKKYTDIEFDLERCFYQISTYTTDWEAMKDEDGYMGQFPPPFDLPMSLRVRSVRSKTPD